MKAVLPLFYLPPVSWFAEFLKDGRQVSLEQFEHFPKQTYRNRANIYGANGKLSLIIPVKHSGKCAMKDIEISYAEDWQKLHWKSIKNAYQSSPYFEYYEEKLSGIFEPQPTHLAVFNLYALEVVLALLKAEQPYALTAEYQKTAEGEDFRDRFSAKNNAGFHFTAYHQTFEDRHGFLSNLSVVDLLCNMGPESLTYLKNLTN